MIENLDFTDKKIWRLENTQTIASSLGFQPDPRFQQVFEQFLPIVEQASVTQFLFILALRYFSEIAPPLLRINGAQESNNINHI